MHSSGFVHFDMSQVLREREEEEKKLNGFKNYPFLYIYIINHYLKINNSLIELKLKVLKFLN